MNERKELDGAGVAEPGRVTVEMANAFAEWESPDLPDFPVKSSAFLGWVRTAFMAGFKAATTPPEPEPVDELEEAFAWVDTIEWQPLAHRAVMASVRLGSWLSAALEDPAVCDAMKFDIREWFSAGEPMEILGQALTAQRGLTPAKEGDELGSYEKFDGIGPHSETIETRARIGERYLEAYESALDDPRLKGYTPADCPSELLLDLLHTNRLAKEGVGEEALRELILSVSSGEIVSMTLGPYGTEEYAAAYKSGWAGAMSIIREVALSPQQTAAPLAGGKTEGGA